MASNFSQQTPQESKDSLEMLRQIGIGDISNSSIDYEYKLLDFSEKTEFVELRELLKTWNQENLTDYLIEQKVLVPVLKVIKRPHMERLLKGFSLGTQILFEHNLEIWRDSIGLPLDNKNKSVPSFNSPSSPDSTPLRTIPPQCTPPRSVSPRFVPYQKPTTTDDYISLASILADSGKGLMLTQFYSTFNVFHEEQRCLLISLIANYYEERSVQLSLGTSYKLEQEICERFPTEKLEYYRVGKRGKIYNKYSNKKSSFKSAVSNRILPPKPKVVEATKPSRYQKEFEPEENAESCLRCLKYDNLTADEFDHYWQACVRYRLSQVKELPSSAAILEKWPFYKQPSGYRLIDMDFKVAFDNKDGLILNWDRYFHSIVTFLSSSGNIKDKKIKAVVETVQNTPDLTENGKYAATLWSLHGYFVPTNIIVTKKDNKRINTKYTIRDSQESFIFIGQSLQEIEDHLRHLQTTKTCIPPFIYCIGDDILSITDFTLYFDNVRYKFTNFIRAVDICFKLMYLFNFDFPVESQTFYLFLESFFYNFKSKNLTSKVHILAEYLRNATNA